MPPLQVIILKVHGVCELKINFSLENTCRRQQRRSAQNDDFLIEKFNGVDFPELSNQKFVYNSTTCQLMEVETCPIASNQTEISGKVEFKVF